MQLEADAARLESGQQLGKQAFDQAATDADQDFRRNQLPMNNLANLINIATGGAKGLTGGEPGVLGAGYGSSESSPYRTQGNIDYAGSLGQRNVLRNLFPSILR